MWRHCYQKTRRHPIKAIYRVSIWYLSHHFIGFAYNSVCHLITCKIYWTISLYMLDSWCWMYCLCLISLWFFRRLLPKDKIITFHCSINFYKSFGNLNAMHQICCIVTVYICILFHWAFVCVYVCVCVFVCECVCFDVWDWTVLACIYSRIKAVPAIVLLNLTRL